MQRRRASAIICLLLINFVADPVVSSDDNCDIDTIALMGIGSSLVSAFYQDIGTTYSAQRSVSRRLNFVYDKVNSAYGKDRITLKNPKLSPIVFAGSEITLSSDEKQAYPDLITFPTVAGPLVIILNLPHVSQLNLTIESVVDIYTGILTHWNDPEIQRVNPDVALPNVKILPIARSDSCGETAMFTTALSTVSQNWKRTYGSFSEPTFANAECCNNTRWPPNAITFYGNRATGIVGLVSSIPYTVGYASYSNTMGTGVTYAKLVNAYGNVVEPSVEGVQYAMDDFFSSANVVDADFEYNLNNLSSPDAYPFASFSYVIFNGTTHPSISCCQMQEFVGFIETLTKADTRENFNKYGIVAASSKLREFVKNKILPRIYCKNASMYDRYKKSLIQSVALTDAQTVTITVVSIVAIGILIGVFVLCYKRNVSNKNLWLISDVKLVDEQNSLTSSKNYDNVSVSTFSSCKTESNRTLFSIGVLCQTGSKVLLSEIPSSGIHGNSTKFDSKTKILFNKFLKQIHHDNLCQFLGVTTIDREIYLVNQYSVFKGTLNCILETCPYRIDRFVKSSLSLDVVHGLKYLHNRRIVHGALTSLDCYLDATWSVKIGHWELKSLEVSQSAATKRTALNSLQILPDSNEELIKSLYVDPEISKSIEPAYQSDIYSLGVLFIEIFTRKLPYFKEVQQGAVTYPQVLRNKFETFSFQPDLSDVPNDVQQLITKMLSTFESRPDADEVFKMAKPMFADKKGIVDALMQSMENYMTELMSTTVRLKELLNDVLPLQIADQLFKGESVKPEFFECCTVFFSDIVGFTTIAARYTPIEVMTFLNCIYTEFDNILERYDVYKVDTIGDAYMVASGLPVRNGINHCKEIGLMSLDLLKQTNEFEIPEFKSEKLKLRMGINSGPVTAGIIGRKMPHFLYDVSNNCNFFSIFFGIASLVTP